MTTIAALQQGTVVLAWENRDGAEKAPPRFEFAARPGVTSRACVGGPA